MPLSVTGARARARVDTRIVLARQGPVIRWRNDFLIIAPSPEPGRLVDGERGPAFAAASAYTRKSVIHWIVAVLDPIVRSYRSPRDHRSVHPVHPALSDAFTKIEDAPRVIRDC